ncbi:MAG: cardiolipin synthase [Spirochaetales bacterium]|nr:cardiolipin synthase [Spirochaetales bacterium]
MNIWVIFKIVNILLIILFSLIILLDNSKPPEVTFAWLMIIFIFQFVGIILYILTGINYKANKIVSHLPEETYKNELADIIIEQKRLYRELKHENEESSDMVKAMSLLLNCSNSIVTLNNEAKYFSNGEDLYNDMFKDLNEAKESIHMEYFIWRSDSLGEKIKTILIEKARNGVEVRLIFDGVGSFNRISLKYKRELRKAGVKIIYFLDPLATPLKFIKFNYCNHRKIVVIDGHIGYTGGVNLGEEYITGGKMFHFWRDAHIRILGDSVRMLQALFLTDWNNSTGERLSSKKYFPVSKRMNGIPMQIAVSGPDSKWSSIHQLYFSMITNANNKIYIQSPYFIPDASILKALETAALSGVEVHLMMTGNPDKKMPFWTAQTYFDSLISAGVKIYLYKKGFLHSKVIIVDDLISTVGSCNMDIRSFHINYEVNAVIYDREVSNQLKEQFFIDVNDSIIANKSIYRKKRFVYKFRDSICRLTSPLM